MKKTTFILALMVVYSVCFAEAHTDRFLSIIGIQPEQTKQEDISSLLGQPNKIEQEKKQAVWHYTTKEGNFDVYWSNKTARLEKLSFSSESISKSNWDNRNSKYLKSGETNMTEVIKVLGLPKDMTIKSVSQELHYSYQNNVLNLFFRKGKLVNYCLY